MKSPVAARSGRPLTKTRWTIEHAASEFGIDRRTLTKQLAAKGILPGEDKQFSTREICEAIYDDYEKGRTRKVNEEADQIALANATARSQLADKPDLLRRFETIWADMRARILNSELSDADKDALLHDLARLHAD